MMFRISRFLSDSQQFARHFQKNTQPWFVFRKLHSIRLNLNKVELNLNIKLSKIFLFPKFSTKSVWNIKKYYLDLQVLKFRLEIFDFWDDQKI